MVREKKAEGLIRDNFVWNKEGGKGDKEVEDADNEEVEKEDLEKIVKKVETVLNGTQNSSAPSPDSISYRFIKAVKDTIQGKKVLEEMVHNLIKGIILEQWQNSKVIIIPNLGRTKKEQRGGDQSI